MDLPKNAMGFIDFMEDIWSMDSRPTNDGGMIVSKNPLYERFHNALKTARFCGMIRTGGTTVGDTAAHIFRFPDEMHNGVSIAKHGGALEPTKRRFGAKNSPKHW